MLVTAAVSVTAPLPEVGAAATAAPVQAETGPNASLEPVEMLGTATAPADPAEVERQLSAPSRAAVARPVVSDYFRAPGAPRVLRVGRRPYDSPEITPVGGFGLMDTEGVRMFRVSASTTLYNHVVFQGSYALQNLNSYRLTGTQAYLDIALKNAQRLVDRHVGSNGAWYYPYDFKLRPTR